MVDGTITYLNTDLDLISHDELTALAGVLESRGLFALHVERRDDGLWYATFETELQHAGPEPNIAAMVAIAEALAEPHRSAWWGCTAREFNVGYDCGTEPWAFTQALSTRLLGRIAALGASLRVTLYPDRGHGTPDTAHESAR